MAFDDLQLFTIPLIKVNQTQTSQIHFIWTIDEVKEVARQKKLSLTDNECTTIFESIEEDYHPSIGVNWDIIGIAIDSFFDNQL